MPNIYVFAVLNVQVRIFSETDKIKLKTKNHEHESGKEFKSRCREAFFQTGSLFELKVSNQPLKNQSLSSLALGFILQSWQKLPLEFGN